jgi:hypothetical protein
MWWVIAGLVVLGGALWGPIASRVEQAQYTVVMREGNREIRDYAAMIVAEAEVAGEREQAIREGFRLIADYIFGNNAPAQKVAMTAPVTQQRTERIPMTAPVTQQGSGTTWVVRFVMPARYTLEALPKPNDSRVQLREIAAKRFAAIRFSGAARPESLARRTEELLAFVRAQEMEALSTPTYAFYNPPWTLPFLRRNEVLVEVAK